jgi:hypothetical protein
MIERMSLDYAAWSVSSIELATAIQLVSIPIALGQSGLERYH